MDFFISNAYAQAGAGPASALTTIGPLILMLVVFYFLLIRPQHTAMVTALKKGDEIVTNGGLGGTVTKVGDAYMKVRVADNVEVSVQKTAVAALLPSGTLKDL